jgi:hypothetical protein
MVIYSPEIPQPNYIKPIITISKDGVKQIPETHQVFEQFPSFKKLLNIPIGEIDKESNLGQIFQYVSLLAQRIKEESPYSEGDSYSWFDLVKKTFKEYDIQLMVNRLGERDGGLFLELLSSLNNLLGDSNEKLTPEEKRVFDEIFFKYLQGEKGILEGIDDRDFYNDLRNNKGPIFALLKEGKVDSRFVIVLNYAFLAYRDWVEQRLSLQRQSQVSEDKPLERRIKEAGQKRNIKLQKAAEELRERFGKGGVGLEDMLKMISEKAKELEKRGIHTTKEELEKIIKEMVEIENV